MRRNGPVENAEFAAMVGRMIDAMGRRAGEGDWTDLALMVELGDKVAAAIADAVDDQRDDGESWANIARGLGISRQAAHQHYRRSAA